MKPLAERNDALPLYDPAHAHLELLRRQGLRPDVCPDCREVRPWCSCENEIEAALEQRYGGN